MSNEATAVSDRSRTAGDRVRTRRAAPAGGVGTMIGYITPAGSWSGTG